MTWALVTGASGGLGKAYASYLASSGCNLILVARNVPEMEALSSEICDKWGIESVIIGCDLTDASERAALLEQIAEYPIDTLVNNAGYGLVGTAADLDPVRQSAMVTLNCVALTELTQALLPAMLKAKRGTIINVASTAAFQPIPAMAAYAASKSYVLSFTQAVAAEVAGSGVRAIAICPGPTDTAFFAVAGNDSIMSARRTPEQVVQTTFAGLRANKRYVIDGPKNRLLAEVSRVSPAGFAAKVAHLIVSREA